jgi:hypothetical protein
MTSLNLASLESYALQDAKEQAACFAVLVAIWKKGKRDSNGLKGRTQSYILTVYSVVGTQKTDFGSLQMKAWG